MDQNQRPKDPISARLRKQWEATHVGPGGDSCQKITSDLPDRRRVVKIHTSLLLNMLTEGWNVLVDIKGGLPLDSKIINAEMNDGSDSVDLLIQSESFSPVFFGEPYPVINPILTKSRTAECPHEHTTAIASGCGKCLDCGKIFQDKYDA